MFVLRKLDRYIVNILYNWRYETEPAIYHINTIISSHLIYECQSDWPYGRIIMQGRYLVSLTASGTFVDIIFLHKNLKDTQYSDDIIKELGYYKLYFYYYNCEPAVFYDSKADIKFVIKTINEIKQIFKHIKLYVRY
jgi:hypothetical protein